MTNESINLSTSASNMPHISEGSNRLESKLESKPRPLDDQGHLSIDILEAGASKHAVSPLHQEK